MSNRRKAIVLLFCILFAWSAILAADHFFDNKEIFADTLRFDEQEASIRAIKKISPAVASIIVYEEKESVSINLFTGERKSSKSKERIGSGTGFIISADGLMLTNKHVIETSNQQNAEYRIILASGKEYYAQLIGKDPINDLAILKIFDKNLPFVEVGDSDKLEQGTTVMAIGNSLGNYQNSVTKGIVSGLGRSITASDQLGNAEALDNIIQTDASINPGNSGGPLIDLNGKVVGINTAMDQGGESIGFAIPINDAKVVINSVKERGLIVRSRLGIRYIMLTPEIAKDSNLPKNYGAWISSGENDSDPVIAGSPAEKAGIQNGDIIFEIDGVKLEGKRTLLSYVQRFNPGKRIGLKIQRGDRIFSVIVTLDEFK